ncbi:IS200/IS605 family transposase [Prolixibacteraceae bacterium JC049]|nr:IS200/IS605 family transposase [Prolixibacteraceae bacterium JC049]
MGNTYTQCYLHIVFAVRFRQALIHSSWKDQLEQYISGIIQQRKHKLLAIGTMPDHIHILIGYNINELLTDLVQHIKTSSNRWINLTRLTKSKFYWQKGYGCFSYSRSQISTVIKYIENQPLHHKNKSFKKEYIQTLQRFSIDYNEDYLFNFELE